MNYSNTFTGLPAEAHAGGPPEEPEELICPECGQGELIPQKKSSLVSEDNPQIYICDECGYKE